MYIIEDYSRSNSMKILILLLSLAYFVSMANAETFYIAPTGSSDSYPGTQIQPWATLQKAIETVQAGDTVYCRGGTYYPTVYQHGHDVFYYVPEDGYGNSGTANSRICYINYPGETPVIDFSTFSVATFNVGVYMRGVHHVTFKGLTFQNLPKASPGPNAMTIETRACSYLHFEQLVIKNGGGAALRYFSGIGEDVGIFSDTVRIINCDFFNNVDSAGNHADGLKYDQDVGAYLLVQGCRAMFNSDDGFDCSGSAVRVFKNNWAFGQGWVPGGNGNGFKAGAVRDSVGYPLLIFINNLSAYNHEENNGGFGFDIVDQRRQDGDSLYYRANARFYNNTACRSDINFEANSNSLHDYRIDVYRNNIAYNPRYFQDVWVNVQITGFPYPESHNTWDYEEGNYSFVETDTVTVTEEDFVMTDSALAVAELMAARDSDGSLPELTFMQLASTSDLIDAGTANGWDEFADYYGIGPITYNGSAPDIGFMEYTTYNQLTHQNPVLKIGSHVNMYPNPACDYVRVSLKEPAQKGDIIQIVNLKGAVMYNRKVNPHVKVLTISVDFNSGIYIVQLVSENRILSTQKLMVDR